MKPFLIRSFLCCSQILYSIEYCEKYAKAEDVGAAAEEKSSDEELSEDDYGSDDEAIAGQPDP